MKEERLKGMSALRTEMLGQIAKLSLVRAEVKLNCLKVLEDSCEKVERQIKLSSK